MSTQPLKRKLPSPASKVQGKASNDPLNPSFMGPPTRGNSDMGMDEVARENPSPAYKVPSLSPASSGSGLARGGTEAVAAYQRKLNSMGANLKVDGAWGDKTQAAFSQFQGKGTPRATIRKASKEVVSGLPGGDLARAQETQPPAPVEKPGLGMRGFLTTKGTKAPVKTDEDYRRDSMEIEAMNGDPEMPGATHLSRQQAAKKVAIETKDSQTIGETISKLPLGVKVAAGVGLGAVGMKLALKSGGVRRLLRVASQEDIGNSRFTKAIGDGFREFGEAEARNAAKDIPMTKERMITLNGKSAAQVAAKQGAQDLEAIKGRAQLRIREGSRPKPPVVTSTPTRNLPVATSVSEANQPFLSKVADQETRKAAKEAFKNARGRAQALEAAGQAGEARKVQEEAAKIQDITKRGATPAGYRAKESEALLPMIKEEAKAKVGARKLRVAGIAQAFDERDAANKAQAQVRRATSQAAAQLEKEKEAARKLAKKKVDEIFTRGVKRAQ